MARILVAWELGAGYGHLYAFPRLAHALRERGHEVLFALRDLARAERVLGNGEFVLLQAPIFKRHRGCRDWVEPSGRSSPKRSSSARVGTCR